MKFAGFVFLGVMVSGTAGYYYIGGEDTTLVDAFYMMGITISTIGFKEVINMDHHPIGRLFTVFLAFSGFGVLTYFVSNLVALFIEGDIRKTFIRNRMLTSIGKMEGHFIICGCGRVGRNIASELHETGRSFLIADANEAIMETYVHEWPGTPYIKGDCTDDDFLEQLGTKKAKGVFVVTGDDNTNLVICLTARQINPTIKIVARSKDVQHIRKMKRAGANRVVTPNFIGGQRMASEMLRPAVTSFLDEMLRSKLTQRMEEFSVPASLDGSRVSELPFAGLDQTLLIALRSAGEWHYNPKQDYIMRKGDQLVLMTTPQERLIIETRFV